MPLHPQVASFLAELKSLGLKPAEACSPEEMRARLRAGHLTENAPEPVGLVEDRPAAPGQAKPRAPALAESETETPLQVHDLHADGRLADVEDHLGGGEATTEATPRPYGATRRMEQTSTPD